MISIPDLAIFLGAVAAFFGLLWLAGRVGEWVGSAPPPPYEPPTHVNVNPIRPYYVGIDHHSPFCRSADGTEFHCECGLADREVPA